MADKTEDRDDHKVDLNKMQESMEAFDGPYAVSVATLWGEFDTTHQNPWESQPVTREKIAQAIRENRLESTPNGVATHQGETFDIERIAYLVVHYDSTPINLEIDWHDDDPIMELNDGYHRLTAAWYRGDQTIAVTYGGWIEGFHRLFPERIKLTPELMMIRHQTMQAGSWANDQMRANTMNTVQPKRALPLEENGHIKASLGHHQHTIRLTAYAMYQQAERERDKVRLKIKLWCYGLFGAFFMVLPLLIVIVKLALGHQPT